MERILQSFVCKRENSPQKRVQKKRVTQKKRKNGEKMEKMA